MSLCVVIITAMPTASAHAYETTQSTKSTDPFVHPGLLHGPAELAFIQQQLANNQQPWTAAWEKLQSANEASLDYTPEPHAKVVPGASNNPDIGSSDMSRDARAAYAHALQSSLTQKKVYATNFIHSNSILTRPFRAIGLS